ncbi:MAG TPA: hypothetical protein VF219_12045 [Vicinamibacterales bacterium]
MKVPSWRLAALVYSVSLAGCASLPGTYKVEVPYDAYVCFRKTFAQCLQEPALASANTFRQNVYGSSFAGASVTFQDHNAGTVTASSDGKYQCKSGTVPFTQTLSQTNTAEVIFVSPPLLNQIGEQAIRLDRARAACSRIIDAYNVQLQNLTVQDQQAAAQKAVQYLSAKVENENISPNATVNAVLTAAEITQFGLTPPASGSLKVADALVSQRNSVTQLSDQLRNTIKDQTLNVDYKKQIDDAQSVIDSQLREVGRDLSLLDCGALQMPAVTVLHRYFVDGEWVQQGSVVMLLRKR